MLTVRTDMPPLPPRPLSPLGLWVMFAEIRREMGLPPPAGPVPGWAEDWPEIKSREDWPNMMAS